MGMTEANVRHRIDAGTLSVIEGTKPFQLEKDAVDLTRAQALAKFSDIVDTTSQTAARDLVLPAELVAEWVRAMAAGQELLDDGVERIRRSNRVLTDSLISVLPVRR
jgi:hypothetical protein